MKRILAIILSFAYLLLASGVAMNIHYCMGHVINIDYRYKDSKVCDRCGMENKKGCCHNEFKIVRLTDDQQTTKANIQLAQVQALIQVFDINLTQPTQGLEKIKTLQYHSPPDKRLTAVYLHDCVFRI